LYALVLQGTAITQLIDAACICTRLCCKFFRLHFYQILSTSVKI